MPTWLILSREKERKIFADLGEPRERSLVWPPVASRGQNFEIDANMYRLARKMHMKIRDEWDSRDQFCPQSPDELALNLSVWNPSYADTLESGRGVAFRSSRSNVSRRRSKKVYRFAVGRNIRKDGEKSVLKINFPVTPSRASRLGEDVSCYSAASKSGSRASSSQEVSRSGERGLISKSKIAICFALITSYSLFGRAINLAFLFRSTRYFAEQRS